MSCVQFCARRPTYSAASRPASKLYDFPLNQRKVNKLPLWRPTSYTYELYTNDWQSYTENLTRSTDWKTYVKHWIRLEHSRLQPHAKQRIDSLHIRTRLMYPTPYNDSRGKRRAVYIRRQINKVRYYRLLGCVKLAMGEERGKGCADTPDDGCCLNYCF